MRKKNPRFNEENKNNRTDESNSNNDRRSSGRRKSFSSDKPNRNKRFGSSDRSSRDGKPFSSKRRNSTSSRNKFSNESRENFRNDNENKGENPVRRSNSDNRERTFSDRKNYSEKRSFSNDRKPRRENSDRSFKRPFNDDRKKPGDRKPYSDNKRDNKGSFEKKPFRLNKSSEEKPKYEGKTYREKRNDKTKFRPRKKIEDVKADDGLIRLNKYVANAGICSRRQADEYIKTGVVEVNGVTITEMGYKVKPEDDVRFDGERISPERKTYILLNKPKGFITTTQDEKDRKTVMELVAGATTARIFPVGRLDRQTTGVLLFTNDGHLAKKLTHPSHGVKKIYHVTLDKELHGDDMDKIREGIRMQEGIAIVDKISFIDNKPHNEVGVEIHIGWNRVVRRIFEKLAYKVVALDRVEFGGLTKKTLKRGDYRVLSPKEVGFLKMI